MAFQLSPGVLVTEEDRTTIIPSVATSAGAFSGAFQWGPVEQVTTVDSENTLAQRFGRPTDSNAGYFFTAANFLSYGNNLQLVRVVDKGEAQNAVSQPSGSVSNVSIITSADDLTTINGWTATFTDPDLAGGVKATGTPFLTSTAKIQRITLTNHGFGYSTAPDIDLSGGNGSGFSGNAELQFGRVVFIVVTAQGNNYTSASNVIIQGGGGSGATANLDVRYSITSVNILNRGDNYQNTATITVGGGSTANLTPVIGYPISSIAVTSGTSQDIPFATVSNVTVDITNTYGTGATASPVIGFSVDSVTVDTAGLNYFSSNVVVTITGGGGTGANAVANLAADGSIIDIEIVNGGQGYTSAPNVVISRNDVANVASAQAVATAVLGTTGRVKSITVNTSGIDYTTSTVATLKFKGNAINGVTLTPAFNSNGRILAATIVNNDFGLTTVPSITINRNNSNVGSEASANATIGYGRVVAINMINQGNNYTSVPTITINKNNALGGSNASGLARVEYELKQINVLNSGSGFTSTPTVVITPNQGDNPGRPAVAVATLGFSIGGVNITNPGYGYIDPPTVEISSSLLEVDEPVTAAVSIETTAPLILNSENYNDVYADGGLLFGEFAAKYPGELGNSIKISYCDFGTYDTWQYKDLFDDKPGTSAFVRDASGLYDEMHIIVLDATGVWTGVVNGVLEKFAFVSKASDAKNSDGSTNYYKDVINNQSQYIWWLNHDSVVGSNWGRKGQNTIYNTMTDANTTVTLTGGSVGEIVSVANIMTGYALFGNDEAYDVSLMPMGPTTDVGAINTAVGIAESRRDVVVFCSPPLSSVLNNVNATTNVRSFRDSLTSSSYAVLDSGWKYQYDRYNDKYRYVPLNGDIAGLAARTDYLADPWFSPAGYNRGVIKNVVKLPYSPGKTDRDELYKKGINPVVTFPGQGTVLFGDKTLLARPSAFDRINVRRLFIILEKAIATAAKFQLFEFNDAFTRAQFRNLVEPFLRDVQGRRGITDFRVICDETNNTGDIIDRNEFVADIFIKPARAINFIQLNFVASRSNVSFEEVGA